MKALLDTNVLVAAFAAEGLCRKLLLRANRRSVRLMATSFILDEFTRVITRKLGASTAEAKSAIELLLEIAEIIDPGETETARTRGLCRDSSDDPILAGALACGADYLITGDDDLLGLKTIGKTKIISPRDFEMLFD